MLEYRIIALDLDGTLLTSNRTITPNTLQLLLALQKKGCKVVISTGRPVFGASRIADQLHLGDYGGYVMAYNGGVVMNWQTKEVVYANYLEPEAITTAYQYATQAGFAIICYHDPYLVSESELNPLMEQSLKRNGLIFRKVDSFLEEVTYPISKCMIIGDPTPLAELERRILATHPADFTVYRSESFFLEVVSPGINKGQGLSVVLDHLSLTPDQLIAFGDCYNDIPMLRLAGLGVTMGNADQEVKDAADLVAPTNDEEGVAKILKLKLSIKTT